MNNILIPATSPEDWKQFLADPEKHWKKGYSARTLAHSWHNASGIPKEVLSVLNQASELAGIEPLFIIPEHKVLLPGGTAASQNDIWALGKTDAGLISITIEGKVSEPFGPTVGEWFKDPSPGKKTRLEFLCSELGLQFPVSDNIRYQLLHRTVSAILEAKRFQTDKAVMIVHSFSQDNEWFDDYLDFLKLFKVEAGINEIVSANVPPDVKVYMAWVHGDKKYLSK